jgi:hypothetical protein
VHSETSLKNAADASLATLIAIVATKARPDVDFLFISSDSFMMELASLWKNLSNRRTIYIDPASKTSSVDIDSFLMTANSGPGSS